MRWVPAAVKRPHQCACIPFVGSHDPAGFFDFGTDMPVMDGHVYVSVIAAQQMAAALGWVSGGDALELQREIEKLRAQLKEAVA